MIVSMLDGSLSLITIVLLLALLPLSCHPNSVSPIFLATVYILVQSKMDLIAKVNSILLAVFFKDWKRGKWLIMVDCKMVSMCLCRVIILWFLLELNQCYEILCLLPNNWSGYIEDYIICLFLFWISYILVCSNNAIWNLWFKHIRNSYLSFYNRTCTLCNNSFWFMGA